MVISINIESYVSKFINIVYPKVNERISFTKNYVFENRSNNNDSLCVILAGYKEFLWDNVFDRFNKFSEDNIDICIVSSGLYSKKLSKIAEEYEWSYISTKRNSITQTQNTAINLFPNAKYIYKIDEDIFITKNFFKTLKNTYEYVQEEGEYDVGFVAPVLPINGYSHVVLLKKLDLIDYFNENFEKVKYATGDKRMIENSPEVAKFMWGDNGIVPHIDDINEMLQNSPLSYSAVPIRFSIGAILFHRNLWENMQYFKVRFGIGLGLDERQICTYCMITSKAMIVSENCCVGHLGFQNQNEDMKKYYLNNPQRFEIKE